jgi:hypothetical protein
MTGLRGDVDAHHTDGSLVPIEAIIFFVSWLALAILIAGLLLRGWKWLLVSGKPLKVVIGSLQRRRNT